MPRVQVPNVGMVQFPDTMSEEQIIAAIQRDILPSVQGAAQPPIQTKPEELGFGERVSAAGRKGLESFGEMLGGLGLAKETIAGEKEAAKARMEGIKAKQKLEEAGPRETLTAEDIARIYKERGLLSAAGQVPSYIAEQLVASAPQMAGPLAVGAAASPFITPVGGAVAGIATYGLQQFGNFLVRQAQEKKDPEELELTKAALTAAGTAPLGYFADRFAAGLGSASSKTVGKEVLSELAKRRAAGEVGISAVGKEVGKRAAKGASMGIIAEAPTEVLEQAAERWQAGLSLTDEEAKREFTEAFFGAAAVGGGLGATSRGIQTYAGYRGELPAASAALGPGKSVIERAGEIDETTRPGAGTGEQGVLSLGGEGGPDTGVGGTTTRRLEGPGEVADAARVREEAERRALEEQRLFDQQFNTWLQTKGMTETDITSNDEYDALVDMWKAEVAKGQVTPPTPPKQELVPPPPPPVDNSARIAELNARIQQAQNYLRDPGLAEDQYNYAVAQIQQLQSELNALKAQQTARPMGAGPVGIPLTSLDTVEKVRALRDAIKAKEDAGAKTMPQEAWLAHTKMRRALTQLEDALKDLEVGYSRENITAEKRAFLDRYRDQELRIAKETLDNQQQIIDAAQGRKPKGAQSGFDFGEAPEGDVQRAIETGPAPEFALEAETGALPTGDVVPLEALGAQPRSRMGLISEGAQPLEPITNFLNALKPVSELDTQAKNYRAEVNKIQALLREFMGQPAKMVAGRTPGTRVPDVSGQLDPQEGMLRAAYLDQFFDTLSAVPPGREEQTMSLPQRLVGMNAQDQARTFEQLLDIPNLNTYRGIQELRERVEDALQDYEQQKLGEKAAVLPFKAGATDEMSPFVLRAIRDLADIPANQRDKYEKAAYTYFSRKVSGADPYNMAMRSAAYDLGVTIDPFFKGAIRKGEGKEEAANFLYWIRNNLPQQEYRRFRATVREFKRMTDKAERFVDKSRQVIRGDVGKTYITSISRAPTGKTQGFKPDAGLGPYRRPSKGVSVMHPAIEEKIRQGDLRGALLELAGDKSMYIGRVAKRLAELPLNTSISIGNAEPMFDSYIKAEYGQTYDSLMNFLKFAYPEVSAVFEGKGVRDTFTALQMLKSGQFPGVDPMPLIGQLEVLLEAYGDAVSMMDKPGAYFPHLDAININPDMGGMSNYVFLHEVAHAASYWALDPNNFDKLTPAQQRAVGELNKLYESVRTNKELNGEYGLTDIYEFVAEALSNRRFQVKLRKVNYEGETSYWDRFVRFISQLVGLNNVLGQTLINANQILMAPPPVTDHAKVMAASDKPQLSSLDGTRRTGNAGMGLGQMISASFQGRPSWETMKAATPIWLESLKDSTRKYYLGAFTLRQLADMIGHKLPMFKTFVDSVEQMLDDRNAVLTETSNIARAWQNFQDKNPKLANVLNKLMIDSTVDAVDPSKGKTGIAAVDKAWNEIGEEGRKIYNDVKNFYKKRLEEYVKVILDRKAESLIGKGVSENAVTSHPEYLKLKEHFEKNVIEPYFPLRRFGNYWLQIGKGESKEFYQFESALERNLFAKQRKSQIKGDVRVRTGNQIEEMLSSNMQDFSFLKDLKELLDVTPGASKGTYKKNLEESIEQLYLMTLPDKSIRKMFLNRQGIQGMNSDMLRAFTSSAFHMAYQHSRFKHSAKLYGIVDTTKGFLEGQDTDEAKVNRDYIAELAKRVDYIMNPTDTGTIPSILSNASFIWYMTAPASALVNMLGVPAIGMPVVSAKFGAGATSRTMLKYAKMVGTSGFRDADGKVAFPSLMNKESKLSDVQKKAFEKFVNDGLLDITLQHDIVGMADAPSNLYTGRGQRVMKVLSGLFHGAEKFNREVVAMSAFELAYERNIKTMSPERAFEKAIDTAKELTYKSMFDYSTLNKPRYFQNATAKVVLQFKQFSQQMTYMLARSAYEGFYRKFSPTELIDIGNEINATRRLDGQPDLQGADLRAAVDQYIKEMRSEGKKRLFGTLGMTFVFAGATGLPGWWALSKMAEAIEYAFREEGEEDKPFDFDNWFKNWMAETFGGFAGDSITRGVVSQVFGVNLADRMGLNDLWFRDTRKSTDEVTALQNFVFSLLGPSAGLAINAAEGLKQLNEGYIWRATETVTPAVIKNVLKGIRLSDTFGEGRATTKKGDILVDDLGIGEVLGQSIGFSPERVAQRQKANIEMKTAEQEILDKRQSLMNAYFMAIDNGDTDMMERVAKKIARFNSSNPTVGITGSKLSRSIRERYRQRMLAQLTGGMNINKKLIGELGGMAAYGNPED